jgi:DNA-binding NarL/FixJ family response regulator
MGADEQAFHRLTFLPLPLAPLLRRAVEGANFSPAWRLALGSQTARLFSQPLPVRPPREAHIHTLTERELEVLQCLERRLTNDEIGQELFISTITARNHVGHVCSKLGVSGRRAAVTAAREQGLLD